MTLEELKKDNPNLFNEVLELGKKEERERLKAINKILNPEFAKELQEKIYDGKSTAEEIELEQYRKMFKLQQEKLNQAKTSIFEDGVSLGKQTLELEVGEVEKSKEEQKRKQEEEQLKADMEAMLSGVRRRVDE